MKRFMLLVEYSMRPEDEIEIRGPYSFWVRVGMGSPFPRESSVRSSRIHGTHRRGGMIMDLFEHLEKESGLHIIWLPVNQCHALMWHETVPNLGKLSDLMSIKRDYLQEVGSGDDLENSTGSTFLSEVVE